MDPADDLSGGLRQLEERLPHRPPFRLVDRLLASSDDEAVALRRVTANDPLVAGTLAPTLLIEALAQTAALMTGATLGAHLGYLVAMRDVRFEGVVAVGDTIELRARHAGALGALRRVDAQASIDGRVIARGELTFAIQPA